ncbi:MAG: SigE family RNA polymerase sigma factor [Micromonosporaceae bacterium]
MATDPAVDQAFGEFVAGRSAALLNTAYLLVGDWQRAEDLLQTALTKSYLSLPRIRDVGALEGYVRRVMVNTAASWWRRRWRAERPTDVLPETPVHPLDGHAEREALWRQILTLPVRQRAVLVLRYYEDLSEAETARVLDISIGTVKSTASRALATLRTRLSDDLSLLGGTP